MIIKIRQIRFIWERDKMKKETIFWERYIEPNSIRATWELSSSVREWDETIVGISAGMTNRESRYRSAATTQLFH